mmetsp:Transcript_86131/g.248646  ORF Transcript_86131/g.248646 Transcript_86131/m.248646 type:complete len:104 (-) Transcript_86131:450-761(-)
MRHTLIPLVFIIVVTFPVTVFIIRRWIPYTSLAILSYYFYVCFLSRICCIIRTLFCTQTIRPVIIKGIISKWIVVSFMQCDSSKFWQDYIFTNDTSLSNDTST